MARRFGSPPEAHMLRVKDFAKRIVKVAKEFKVELRKGNCVRAHGLLSRMDRLDGSMLSDRIGVVGGFYSVRDGMSRAAGSARIGIKAHAAFMKRCRITKR